MDATCPLVTKVHSEVDRYAGEGRTATDGGIGTQLLDQSRADASASPLRGDVDHQWAEREMDHAHQGRGHPDHLAAAFGHVRPDGSGRLPGRPVDVVEAPPGGLSFPHD